MKYIKIVLLVALPLLMQAQVDSTEKDEYFDMNYQRPKKYTIGGIGIKGVKFLDQRILSVLSGLYEGQVITLPGEELSRAIDNLWKQKFFVDIQVRLRKIEEGKVFIDFYLEERPRLATPGLKIRGLKKRHAKNLREDAITAQSGQIVTENVIQRTRNEVVEYFKEKGYYNVKVDISEEPDPVRKNFVKLVIKVDKGRRMKINDIVFVGNQNVKSSKLRRLFSDTKRKAWWRIFKRSKFIEEVYDEEKEQIIGYYNTLGYRDAALVADTFYLHDDKTIDIQLTINEGRQYYFRNITWTGNTKFSSDTLSKLLGIKKGDVYDQYALETRLLMNPRGYDISALYMDDGYLFFQVVPVEVRVEGDSIDLEIRIQEGPQATISSVTVTGNTKTSDHVILREIRTRPGQKFSRTDIQRSIRELVALGYFNPETMDVQPKPNPAAGTVDIEYKVEERSSDQIELSGGFGNGFIVGTLGLNISNFSTRKMFKKRAWDPYPAGDGQRLSIRAQSNGTFFQSYNFSFTEPWFGGKKPNALSFSVFHSIQQFGSGDNRSRLRITGSSLGLGKRLRWPDDFFTVNYSLNYQHYNLQNYVSGIFEFENGRSNNINLRLLLSRNSTDDIIFPQSGSDYSFSAQVTPPVSVFTGIDYKTASTQQKFKWIEYHKWKFDAKHYTKLAKNLVLASMIRTGFMGFYNRDIGNSPFERFYVGGAGLIGFNLDGRELISMRGYRDNSVTPRAINQDGTLGNFVGATIYNKFTMELRYRISPNPQATIYVHSFLEAGNSWLRFKDYNPYNLLRSGGVGVRIFLPMFGLLGVDWGYGFDENPYTPGSNKGQIHFFIGQQL
jgi:outer membrane protein insertion porin family